MDWNKSQILGENENFFTLHQFFSIQLNINISNESFFKVLKIPI